MSAVVRLVHIWFPLAAYVKDKSSNRVIVNGDFQLLNRFNYNRASKSHDLVKIKDLSFVEILFVKKKILTKFTLQSKCCNFDQ